MNEAYRFNWGFKSLISSIKYLGLASCFKYIFLIKICLVFSSISFSQTSCPPITPKVKGAVKAVAFYESIKRQAQLFSINKTESTDELLRTFLRFEIRFKEARDTASNYLKSSIKDYDESILLVDGLKLIDSIFYATYVDDNNAKAFIENLKSLLNGTNSLEDFPFLLSFKYKNNPVSEFLDGLTNTYSTKNHPKAKSTNWQVKLPKSWFCAEAERPSIITKFSSEYGNGPATVMLTVKDIQGASTNQNEPLPTEKEYREKLPANSTLVDYKKLTIEGLPAMKVTIIQKAERMESQFEFIMILYSFSYKGKLYSVSGNLRYSDKTERAFLIKKFEPLFDLIANSIVINDLYK